MAEANIRLRLAALAEHHVVPIPGRMAEVLVLQAVGLTDLEIARELNLSESTCHKHAHAARLRAVPAELDASRSNSTAWAWQHLSCCLAAQSQYWFGTPLQIGQF